MQFQRDAQQQQNEAQNALREAEQAAEDTVTLANRVAEATKRAVANAQALDPSNQAPSSSSANSDAWAKANVPLQLPPMPTSPSTLQTIPLGRPIDPITSTVAQLNNLVVGTAPAFSTAMRLATDSVATGIASHNAVSHQANQSITALLMQMRASANLVKGE